MIALLVSTALAAPGFGLRLDVGPQVPISRPQVTYFGVGVGGTLTGELAVLDVLDLEVQVGFASLSASASAPVSGRGTLLGVGAGARLRRPLSNNLVVPWGEVLVNYGFSGGSHLPLTFSAGLSLKPTSSGFLVGPWVRLQHVFALGTTDASAAQFDLTMISLGLSLEYLNQPSELPEPPVVESSRDGDTDGVPDDVDRCPQVAEDKDGHDDADGCPDDDDDGDGVSDLRDACPKAKGLPALRGCPDSDADGVADAEDACPKVAGRLEDGGCPTYKQVRITELKIEISQKIFFAFGTTKILPKSEPLLDEVAQALNDRGSLCVRVEGHTDAKGSREQNFVLSEGRAAAVRDYLLVDGIDSARLSSKGYADTLPIDSNGTVEGRENNRRVEFVIIPCSPHSSSTSSSASSSSSGPRSASATNQRTTDSSSNRNAGSSSLHSKTRPDFAFMTTLEPFMAASGIH